MVSGALVIICQCAKKWRITGKKSQQIEITTINLTHSELNPQYPELAIRQPQNNPNKLPRKIPLEILNITPQLLHLCTPVRHRLKLGGHNITFALQFGHLIAKNILSCPVYAVRYPLLFRISSPGLYLKRLVH